MIITTLNALVKDV